MLYHFCRKAHKHTVSKNSIATHLDFIATLLDFETK